MGTNRSSICRASRVILAAALSLTAVANAKAFEVTAEQRAACTPDALRLCSSEIPDVGRIVACMKAKEASLSPQCRTVFQTASLSRPLPSHQRVAHRAASTYASNGVAPASSRSREAFQALPSRDHRIHRMGSTYASNRAAPSSYLGHRYSRQAFQPLASHSHGMHRMGSTYASSREPSYFAGGRWRHARDEREALIIGRKVMMGFAMACQNHSIPAELCNLSGSSSSGPDYQGAWGSMSSMETSASEGSREHGGVAGHTNNIELESFLGSFVTR
jgi:hypothetical protein